MEAFTYSYPVKVYFGEKAAEKNLPSDLRRLEKMCCSPMASVLLKRMVYMTS